jgi:hypothetical protein
MAEGTLTARSGLSLVNNSNAGGDDASEGGAVAVTDAEIAKPAAAHHGRLVTDPRRQDIVEKRTDAVHSP